MPNLTQNDRSSRNVLTADDVIGMFEAGLEELSSFFTFTVSNTDDGVILHIVGLRRDDLPDGAWCLNER